MRLFADYHTHTCYSHGTGTVLQNARAARARALCEIAISEHGPANLFRVGIADLDTFACLRQDIAAAQTRVPEVRILYACEANIIDTDGRLDIPLPMQAAFDLVLAGLHTMVQPHSWWHAAQLASVNLWAKLIKAGERKALVANTDAVIAAVYRNKIDIITHPGYRLPIDTQELAKACAATGTAMEINTSHQHTTLQYVRLAAATGVRFAIGSDAHQPERVGDLWSGIELAEQAGVGADQILNAMSEGRDETGGSELSTAWRTRRRLNWRTR